MFGERWSATVANPDQLTQPSPSVTASGGAPTNTPLRLAQQSSCRAWRRVTTVDQLAAWVTAAAGGNPERMVRPLHAGWPPRRRRQMLAPSCGQRETGRIGLMPDCAAGLPPGP